MKTLNEIYKNYMRNEHHGDKGTTHTYIDVYQEILKPYRENSNFLEIGLYGGESLKMWNDYFINSNVYGVEINEVGVRNLLNNPEFNIFIHDATSPTFLNLIGDLKFDVIIDDGSHYLHHQVKSFNLLKDRMNPGGLYIVEDVTDIDSTKNTFMELHNNCEIIDNRHIKNRFDDVLILYRF